MNNLRKLVVIAASLGALAACAKRRRAVGAGRSQRGAAVHPGCYRIRW